MRVTPIQRSVFSNRRRSQTWSGNPSDSHDSHDSEKSQKDLILASNIASEMALDGLK